MLKRPRFRPDFHVEVLPGEGVVLLSEARHFLLRGQLYELVAPCLNGRTADGICEQLRSRASPAEVYYALNQLERKGYVCEAEETFPSDQGAWWSSQQISPDVAARRLAERAIVVRSIGADASPFLELLESMHVRVSAEGPADIVVTDSAWRSALGDRNAESLQTGRPWLLVKPTGRQVWIGPLFHPGKTGCWECLMQRLRANCPVAAYLEGRNGHAGAFVPERAATPASVQVGLGLAANAVASWIVRGESPDLEGKLRTFDVTTWRLQEHTLVRLPYCPACGNANERHFEPLSVNPRKKTFTNDGGHRVIAPEETLERNNHHISPLTGAVPILERAGKDEILHVYFAGNNAARPSKTLGQLRHLRTMNAGKGTGDIQARASALCEGLERYSGVFRGDEPRRRARMTELGGAAVAPNECQLFSESQFRERNKRNGGDSLFSFIPVPFDPEADIEWSPVWSLTRREIRYLPTSFCYYDYPEADEQTYCVACSNGCAAGNTLEEAILQGFLELVERDAVALWWYNRVRRPGVDLDSFAEPYLDRLRVFLQDHGRDFWVLDLTSDLGIPVFAAITRRTDGPAEQIMPGFGAHLDPKVALLRAVTEMNQMLSSPLLGLPDSGDKEHVDLETAHWLKTATIANQPYVLPLVGQSRKAHSFTQSWSDDVADDIRLCQTLVERAGMEMLVLDQTRPEIGLPVAKVIVPGLRHFWARLAPGRLYDVPVQLGWLPRRLAEHQLNPIAMFL